MPSSGCPDAGVVLPGAAVAVADAVAVAVVEEPKRKNVTFANARSEKAALHSPCWHACALAGAPASVRVP